MKKPNVFIIDELIKRFIKDKVKFSSYEDGNIKYILVYSNADKCLNLYGLINYYSKLIYSIEYRFLKEEIKSVLD